MRPISAPRGSRGFSLIELMVGLLIGGLVVAAAGGLFIANKRTYSTTETISRVQENSRVAFELMARDVREAGGSACGSDLEIVNVLTNRSTAWWANLAGGLRGYDNGALAGSLAGTDAIDLVSGNSGGVDARTPGGSATNANFDTRPVTHGFQEGDIAVVCDNQSAAVFQVSVNSTQLVRNAGAGTPGNCTTRLGPPQASACNVSSGVPKAWNPPSVVARLQAARWFVADNGRGSTSLFRRTIQNTSGTVGEAAAEEIVEGVTDLQMRYLVSNAASYVPASGAVSWPNVVSVEIEMTLSAVAGVQQGNEIRGTDGNALTRTISHRVNLRNRTP